MAKASKRQTQGQPQTAKPAEGIPKPFVAAPAVLDDFLGALDPASIYIFHVDTLPWRFKRQIWLVPFTMNIAIAALLAWRAWTIFPTYANFLLIAMGYESPESVDTSSQADEELRWLMLKRAGMVLFDFVLFRFIGFWPYAFFFEQPVSPFTWRYKLGFQETEIVVRVSKQWGSKEFWESTKSFRGREVSPTNPILRERILPAVDSEWMRERTGYMMMGRDYDLDLPAMLDADRMIKKGDARYGDFAKSVFAHLEGVGWCMWRVDPEGEGEAQPMQPDLQEEEARKRMELFRERVTALGKEHLFYRWIELLQYESQQPGGLTPERQEDLVKKARELFGGEGIDFDSLFSSVGGVDGFPGLGKDR